MESRIQNAIDLINYFRNKPDDKNLWYSYGEKPDKKTCAIIDTLDILEEMKEYEVTVSDDELDELIASDGKCDNSYNWNAPVSNHLDMMFCDDDIIVIKAHMFGDVRAHYTDYFVIKMNMYEFFELESCSEHFSFDGYQIDINFFSEVAEVYNNDGYHVCTSCELELKDIASEAKEHEND